MKFIISKMNLDRNGYKIISYNASDNTKLSVSRGIFVGIGISMSALFVCALTVNILVLYIFKRTKTLHTRTNYWIMSVITCDLLTVINTFPFVIISSFAEEYIFGEIGCKWYGFMFTLLGTTSIFLLTGISVQRYLIICKNRNQTRIQKGKLVGPMFFCFLLGLLCAVFPLIGWGSYTIEGLNISCEPNWKSDNVSDKSYKLFLFVFALFVPGSILAFCYTMILYKVWNEKRIQSDWIRKRRTKRNIKLTFSVAVTVVCFLISWGPYAVVSLYGSFLDIEVKNSSQCLLLVHLPRLLAKASCMVNPLVYVCNNDDFKKAFRNMFHRSRTNTRYIQQRSIIQMTNSRTNSPYIQERGRTQIVRFSIKTNTTSSVQIHPADVL